MIWEENLVFLCLFFVDIVYRFLQFCRVPTITDNLPTAFSNCNPFSTAVVFIGTCFLTISEIFRLFQNRLFSSCAYKYFNVSASRGCGFKVMSTSINQCL